MSEHNLAVGITPAAQQLLQELHRDGKYAYLWTSRDKRSHWFEHGAVPEMPDPATHDLYFGVHPTTAAGGEYERSTIAKVSVMNCLFAEFDFSDFKDEEVCWQHIYNLDPQPNA